MVNNNKDSNSEVRERFGSMVEEKRDRVWSLSRLRLTDSKQLALSHNAGSGYLINFMLFLCSPRHDTESLLRTGYCLCGSHNLHHSLDGLKALFESHWPWRLQSLKSGSPSEACGTLISYKLWLTTCEHKLKKLSGIKSGDVSTKEASTKSQSDLLSQKVGWSLRPFFC